MEKNWKDDIPVYSARQCDEYLYSDQLDRISEIPWVFLGNYENKGRLCDLYYLSSGENREENILIQHSDELPDYGSGMIFAHQDYSNGEPTARREAMIRAIELGLLKEKDYFVGFSFSYADELENEYYSSEYMGKKPLLDFDYANSLSDDEWDKYDEALNKEQKEYDQKFLKEHGYIPSTPSAKTYFTFESMDKAKEHCGKDGYVACIKATSLEHLNEAVKAHGVYDKAMKLSRAAQRPSRCNESDSPSPL